MRILSVETSCDDTAVAIVENGRKVLISLVSSQEQIHAQYGGVVPEVASRQHLTTIFPLIEQALSRTKLTVRQIDALAVTTGPGLLGSLLVGVNAVRTLGYLWGKPVISVNHLLGHLYSGFLTPAQVQFPILGVIVSGGHTEFVAAKKHGDYKYVGGTYDDAAGEAFDKTARLLGLAYPGGPAISRAAEEGKPGQVSLPRPMLNEGGPNLSFSGLKTAVSRLPLETLKKTDVAYEFQEAVAEVLGAKLGAAIEAVSPKTIIFGGGVAANGRIRNELARVAGEAGVEFVVSEPKYCTDNAAMIGAAAYFIANPRKDKWYNAKVKI